MFPIDAATSSTKRPLRSSSSDPNVRRSELAAAKAAERLERVAASAIARALSGGIAG